MRAVAQDVDTVGPMLHHADSVGPQLRAVVNPSRGIVVNMGELQFDNVRVPHGHSVLAALAVGERRERRAEAVRAVVDLSVIAHFAQRLANGAIRHGLVVGRKYVTAFAGQLAQLGEDRQRLMR